MTAEPASATGTRTIESSIVVAAMVVGVGVAGFVGIGIGGGVGVVVGAIVVEVADTADVVATRGGGLVGTDEVTAGLLDGGGDAGESTNDRSPIGVSGAAADSRVVAEQPAPSTATTATSRDGVRR